MKIHLKKYYIFYLFLFILLYVEDRVFFFDISLSNIWKILAIIIFLILITQKKINRGLTYFDITIALLVFSFFINSNGFLTILDIEEIVIILVFPIAYYSFYYFYKNTPIKLNSNLLILSTFLILTSIPFLLKIIQPNHIYVDALDLFADHYGLKTDILVGFFKQASISSKVFVFSSVVTLVLGIMGRKLNNPNKLFYVIIFIVGLYAIYRSFTRTGWVMLIAFIIIYFMQTNRTSIVKKTMLITVFVFSLFLVYHTNNAVKNRVIGINITSNKIDNATILLNSRNILIANAIQTVIEEDINSLILGLGKKNALEKSYGSLAHSRFIEIFQYGGLLSLSLYVAYLILMYKQISKRKNEYGIYSLSMSLYIIMLLSLFPSHGLSIWSNIIFGGVVALNRINYEI